MVLEERVMAKFQYRVGVDFNKEVKEEILQMVVLEVILRRHVMVLSLVVVVEEIMIFHHGLVQVQMVELLFGINYIIIIILHITFSQAP
jgi:hypothetical protein